MKLHLIFTFLYVAVVVSHAGLPSVVNYWNSMLPQTPIAKVVEKLLHNEWTEKDKSTSVGVSIGSGLPAGYPYFYAATEDELHDYANISIFFTEKELNPGSTMNLQFVKNTSTPGSPHPVLLPRVISESIPFSSHQIPEIYDKLLVAPHSEEARIMKNTIEQCELPSIKGEEKYCATSLESMIDFTISKLGKQVNAISTEVENEAAPVQKYTVVGRVSSNKAAVVICHKLNYAYAVFYCHKSQNTEAFQVSLVGADGTKVKAVAVCHNDTSEWNPKHLAFHLLKIKPGTTIPVCHFIPQHHIAWVTTN